MKFSEQWLREWVNPPVSTQQLADQLTMAGLEVESITPVAGQFSKVLVGYVIEAVQHPDAERLRVCKVDVGQAEILTIVCGGKNVRTDQKVPVAVVGAVLPGNFKIGASKLRGIVSQGMICSTSELGLTENSDGIMELPMDAPVGTDFREWLKLDDNAIDIHFTPNRGDCLSIAGIAREVAVLNNMPVNALRFRSATRKFKNLRPSPTSYGAPRITHVPPQIDDQLTVQVTDAVDCPRYLGRIIRGINSQALTPNWMIERLRRSGLRSIHPVVDVTNYVLLELGQPLHAFDLAKLTGGITVRLATDQEKITLLDGQVLKLDAQTLVIADQQQAQAVAGIMGGLDSAVSDTTQDIFLESAFFNPISIAGRARRYGLNTDSAYRFERGVDPELAPKAIERATQLLLEIAGGKVGPVVEVTNSKQLPKVPPILLRSDRITRVLGITIDAEKITTILQQLGMQVVIQNSDWLVTPPSYRFDITLEEDLIEEVARIYGYDQIPAQTPQSALKILANSEQQLPLTRLRQVLIDRGYHEAITYSFVAPKLQQLINPDQTPIALVNPISADLSVMRTSVWPGLLTAVSYNQNRQQNRIRLFETGLRFPCHDQQLIQEPVLAGIVTGELLPTQWGAPQRTVDFFDVKGDLEALFALLGPTQKFSFVLEQHPALHPGQSSAIHCNGKTIGYFGSLHPKLIQELDLIGPVYLFEMQLTALMQTSVPQFQIISKFPAIRRDLSFVIPQAISAQAIQETVQQAAGELLTDVSLFDVYQGKGVEEGHRSLAISLLWQHPERTLVDDEINSLMQTVVTSLREAFAIQLRE